MTKPAAFFLQVIGFLVILASPTAGHPGGWFVAAIGVGLIVWGGRGVRQRIKNG